jgi:hypothetical protein
MELDHAALLRIQLLEAAERLVDGEQLFIAILAVRVVERGLYEPAAPFRSEAGARVINGDPTHELRRHREEVRAIAPLRVPRIDQLQIRLVNERGRLQRRARTLSPHLAPRDATKLVS